MGCFRDRPVKAKPPSQQGEILSSRDTNKTPEPNRNEITDHLDKGVKPFIRFSKFLFKSRRFKDIGLKSQGQSSELPPPAISISQSTERSIQELAKTQPSKNPNQIVRSPILRLPVELIDMICYWLGQDCEDASKREEIRCLLLFRPKWTRMKRTSAAHKGLRSMLLACSKFARSAERELYRRIPLHDHNPDCITSIIRALLVDPNRRKWVEALTVEDCRVDPTRPCFLESIKHGYTADGAANQATMSLENPANAPLNGYTATRRLQDRSIFKGIKHIARQCLSRSLGPEHQQQLFEHLSQFKFPFYAELISAIKFGHEEAQLMALLTMLPNLMEFGWMPNDWLVQTNERSFCMRLFWVAGIRASGIPIPLALPVILPRLENITLQSMLTMTTHQAALMRIPGLTRLEIHDPVFEGYLPPHVHSGQLPPCMKESELPVYCSTTISSPVRELVLRDVEMTTLRDEQHVCLMLLEMPKLNSLQMSIIKGTQTRYTKGVLRLHHRTLESLEWTCSLRSDHLPLEAQVWADFCCHPRLKHITLCEGCLRRWIIESDNPLPLQIPGNLETIDFLVPSAAFTVDPSLELPGPYRVLNERWTLPAPCRELAVFLWDLLCANVEVRHPDGRVMEDFTDKSGMPKDPWGAWNWVMHNPLWKCGWAKMGISIYLQLMFECKEGDGHFVMKERMKIA
ncbi:hypothetical protein P152DRAFT_171940 [Eremomyces bilateralis CBS 781.70]|uniref:Uncharacterized protein n=1 Tax=Eremomyces bilateralis CBS 781.70 TaxID=1392243 RepID=A0A6G1FTW2_9PEZI|nr:uncharacterized protein P152DRAFT_171940 [Eremomyces bilateralis CBS 781.70]KAF1809180.1 hypothetical protein P152DRAFT_171940 [Eremomyces bilateralis CBS 781.70]